MTGFGSARRDLPDCQVVVEARAVNGRFLKTTTKLPSHLNVLEAPLEARAKARLRRGSLALSVFVARGGPEALVRVNESVVRAYQEVFARLGLVGDCIPMLPGVMGGSGSAEREEVSEALLGAVQACADEALTQLLEMRRREGQALVTVLADLCDRLDANRAQVRDRAPTVVAEYQTRSHGRLNALLSGADLPVDDAVLAREVAVFADRCDVTEEVDRLGAHLAQVRGLLEDGGEVGRTLEFLAQEMHREVNTIGSKSSDTLLSRVVVQMKADVERFKEQVANVE